MQTELVEKKRWISQSRFLHALNYCMLLPGPEAQQLAIYIGWLLHKTWGGIVAGAFFVIPSIFILWGLSFVYAAYGNVPWIAAIFYGLKPAVIAIVARRRHSHRPKSAQERSDVDDRRAGLRRHLFFQGPVSAHHLSAGLIGFARRAVSGNPNSTSSPARRTGSDIACSTTKRNRRAHTRPSIGRARQSYRLSG